MRIVTQNQINLYISNCNFFFFYLCAYSFDEIPTGDYTQFVRCHNITLLLLGMYSYVHIIGIFVVNEMNNFLILCEIIRWKNAKYCDVDRK